MPSGDPKYIFLRNSVIENLYHITSMKITQLNYILGKIIKQSISLIII